VDDRVTITTPGGRRVEHLGTRPTYTYQLEALRHRRRGSLAEEPTAWRYGYQLCQQLGIKPGSLLDAARTAARSPGGPVRKGVRTSGGRAHEVDPTQGSDRHDLGRRGGVDGVPWRRSRECRPAPPPDTAVVQLVVPPLPWVIAARLVLRHWWSEPGSRMSGRDLPGRLLAVAVAALPNAGASGAGRCSPSRPKPPYRSLVADWRAKPHDGLIARGVAATTGARRLGPQGQAARQGSQPHDPALRSGVDHAHRQG
jgi:hypothetical protein